MSFNFKDAMYDSRTAASITIEKQNFSHWIKCQKLKQNLSFNPSNSSQGFLYFSKMIAMLTMILKEVFKQKKQDLLGGENYTVCTAGPHMQRHG